MSFEFTTVERIIFGEGTIGRLGTISQQFGKQAMVVTGAPEPLTNIVYEILVTQDIENTIIRVDAEPTTHFIAKGLNLARDAGCDMVIGFGGGSAIDTAKAIAALLSNGGELFDYLEVIGRGKPIIKRSIPLITIPTTAGTGSEVTRNAVLASPEHSLKVSMRSPLMLAHIALIDPELTYSLPPAVTASTGLDALTQVIEPYVSNAHNPITDAICCQGMQKASQSLLITCQDGQNQAARRDMAITSLFGGLALANASLGAVHGFASPLGGMYHAPHGVLCACLLPHVMAVNVRALQKRTPESEAVSRYREVARLLINNPTASIQDGVMFLHDLVQSLKIPSLSSHGIKATDFPKIIAEASKASSMRGNPVTLLPEELEEILTLAL